ncbi:hypothetical protein [Vibrio sp. SCSIO 43169]|uniref:hypothetical protein n=1 Tax=Vibrio sp. SCSIO 43169 TaxID=2822801 RepID=UPI0020447A87|nr:hypothetical protein [Vibrio sp. SCSIO 43169]MCM5511649.1 hypothetical protein [Vibrio sp. SCSIO 43169]
MKKLLILMLGTMLSGAVLASKVQNTKIIEVRSGPWYGTIVTFKVASTPSSQPTCSNMGDRGHYVFDTSNPGGGQWLSMVLSAHASGKTVQVWGTGKCLDVHSNTLAGEELETIAIK